MIKHSKFRKQINFRLEFEDRIIKPYMKINCTHFQYIYIYLFVVVLKYINNQNVFVLSSRYPGGPVNL